MCCARVRVSVSTTSCVLEQASCLTRCHGPVRQIRTRSPPEQYRDALSAAGFEILSERQRRDVALDYFARQRAQAVTGPAALGVHILMGARRPEMVRNMSDGISAGLIAPIEIIVRRR